MLAKRTRITKNARREMILAAAYQLAETKGYKDFSCLEVCARVGCTHTLVFHHFQSMEGLQKAVMLLAIRLSNAAIVLQGLVSRDPFALCAPEELRDEAKAILNLEG